MASTPAFLGRCPKISMAINQQETVLRTQSPCSCPTYYSLISYFLIIRQRWDYDYVGLPCHLAGLIQAVARPFKRQALPFPITPSFLRGSFLSLLFFLLFSLSSPLPSSPPHFPLIKPAYSVFCPWSWSPNSNGTIQGHSCLFQQAYVFH